MLPQPWRNGGGRTRELLVWPAGDGLGGTTDWQLRVSVADITKNGLRIVVSPKRGHDPQQLVNRADDTAYAPVVVEALRRLVQWRMRHDDRTLSTYHLSASAGLLHHAGPRR